MIEDTVQVTNMEKKVAQPSPRRNGSGVQSSQLDQEKVRRGNVSMLPGGNGKIAKKQQQYPKGGGYSQKSYGRGNGNYRREKNFSKDSKKLIGQNSNTDAETSDFYESFTAESLLNFQYAPMRNSVSASGGSKVYSRRKRTTTYNKEVFLQANCNFVVKDTGDYKVHSCDPDVLVDWDLVELVYLPTHDAPQCPICLFPPQAAKITRCGHVYCFSCILHYLQLGEQTWRKCPICHEAVHDKDLKSVIASPKKKFQRTDVIKLKLMKREKGSLVTTPYQEDSAADEKYSRWTGNFDYFVPSKLMLADCSSVIEKIVHVEKATLEAQLWEAKSEQNGEECFIEGALAQIKAREEKLIAASRVTHICQHDAEEKAEPTKALLSVCAKEEQDSLADLLKDAEASTEKEESAFSDDEDLTDGSLISPSSCSPTILSPTEASEQSSIVEASCQDVPSYPSPSSREIPTEVEVGASFAGKPTEDYYYFYQAEDNQNIFIHPLNARCLIEEYGALQTCPEIITGTILDYESFTMNKILRKRYRYLSHLPLACEFVIVELMLRPPILSKQTIRSFMPEFQKRKALRARKQEELRKFEKKAAAALREQDGFQRLTDDLPSLDLDITDAADFPMSFSQTPSGGSTESEPSPEKPPTWVKGEGSGAIADEESEGKFSFAQMLRTKNANATQQPVTVRRPAASSTTTSKKEPVLNSDGEEESEAPAYRDMFRDALFSVTPVHVPNKKGGGKKKNKGQLLFATGGQRKY